MGRETQIEPVPPGAVNEALRFLAGGRRRDVSAALRAEAYERMIARCGGGQRLWWARRGGQCLAASLVLPGFGRVGMLIHSSVDCPGVEAESARAVVQRASRQGLDDGLAFVQSLLEPARRADIEMLVAAGLQRLAELVYMRLDLAGPIAEEDEPGHTWRSSREFTEGELSRVIEATYKHSLDCPPLRGLRRMSDVIAGHKASGVFRPESWWIVDCDGRPAGCILVNDSAVSPGSAELVYMGVVGEFRGRGVGRAMVLRAARRARRGKRSFLTVAVDSENVYAKRIYLDIGFRRTSRRLAYFLPGRPTAGPAR